MREFLEELKYACTEGKQRGFYCLVTFFLVLLMLCCVASLVMMIVNVIAYKAFSVLWLILFLVTLGITVGIIVWLKKS